MIANALHPWHIGKDGENNAASATVLLGFTNGDVAGEGLFIWTDQTLTLLMSSPQGAPIVHLSPQVWGMSRV